MLSDQQSELITSFLDGELSRRERKLALRLLRRSGEARTLLQRLQEDANGLQLLPQRKLPADFSQRVLRTIRERGLRPTPRPATLPFRPKAIPAWVGVAVAAAILILVGTGSYLVFDALFPPTPSNPGFVELPKPPDKVEVEPKTNPLNPLIPDITQGVVAQFARPVEMQIALKELRQPKAVTQLTQELKRDSSYHLNVSVGNNRLAVQRLQTAMQKQGIQVFMDANVQQQIKKPQPKQAATFVLYTENLQPEELAGLLEQLGKEDKVTPSNPKQDGQVVLAPLSTAQRTTMSQLLGVAVKDLGPPERQGRIDLPMPVHMDPADEKKGQGSPKVKTPPTKNRFAVVLAITPGANANPMGSRAVKDFLARRQAQRPGTLQVVMVVNQLT